MLKEWIKNKLEKVRKRRMEWKRKNQRNKLKGGRYNGS